MRALYRPAALSLLLALPLLAAVFAAAPAQAQDGTPPPGRQVNADEVNRVAKKLYCPVCENIPLDVCPTQACAQWRGTIREKLEAGWSEQSILDYFVGQYGERVLAQPSTRGLNVLVWVLPPVSLAAGIAVLWAFLRRTAPKGRQPAPPAPALTQADPYAAQFEAELARHR